MGYFITFEGVEGSGKTTQISLLTDMLIKCGYRVQKTREPGGCPISDKIRSILLDAENKAMDYKTELLLYAAARAQHISELIKPALAEGKIVICDRFTDATLAYQSYGRGIDREVVDNLAKMACGDIRPHLTILIDCDAAIGVKRAKERIEAASGPKEERFEMESLNFHKRVRNGYLALALEQPERFVKIDATGSIEAIAGVIAEKVIERLKESSDAIC